MNDNAQIETASPMDTVKLMLALALMIGGLVAYYMTPELALPLRVLMVIAGLIAGGVVGLATAKGRQLMQFVQGSRVEIRKVVWPSRQQTWQTTLAVFIFTLLLGLFFWALDAGLLWITRMATGQA